MIEIVGYRSQKRKMFGVDPAQVKHLQVWFVEFEASSDNAQLTDADDNPIDLRNFLRLSAEDFGGVIRVPRQGHPPETKWACDRNCRWMNRNETVAFRLLISEREILDGGASVRRVSTDHPLLGDLILYDTGGDLIGCVIPNLALWHGAEIQDEFGKVIDFRQIASDLFRPGEYSADKRDCQLSPPLPSPPNL
jgi:hypothetical protein